VVSHRELDPRAGVGQHVVVHVDCRRPLPSTVLELLGRGVRWVQVAVPIDIERLQEALKMMIAGRE
jgi:hypothetical protein